MEVVKVKGVTTTMDSNWRSEYPSHSPPGSPRPMFGRFFDPTGHLLGSGPQTMLNTIHAAGNYPAGAITWEPFQEGSGPGYPFTDPLIPPSPTLPPIPPEILAEGIDNSDVSLLLASIAELPFPTAFKMLLASSMALWAASAPDAATVRSLGLDNAIDGFLSFIGPNPPTVISPPRLPIDIPPTPRFSDPLLPSPLPDDEDAVMAPGETPDESSLIRTPTPRPLEKGKMRALEPPAAPEILAPNPVVPSPLPAPPVPPPSCAPVSDHARGRA